MKRLVLIAAGLLVIGSGWTVGTQGTIDVTLTVPADLEPTIVTGTDASGKYKVERLGSRNFKLINVDANLHVILVPDTQITTPQLSACNRGGTGDEASGPWPLLEVTWIEGGAASQVLLDVDQCSTCIGCNLALRWIE